MRVDNAVIMCAGTSSRFAPLSYEHHKALTVVRGEVLIERQIRQLLEAGVPDIYLITGYQASAFDYLKDAYGVQLIHNAAYLERNNNSSIWAARDVMANSYLCSSDNYFVENPFEAEVDDAYYAAEYAAGHTDEWCMTEDAEGYIDTVTVGGENAWYMMGHTFWSQEYSERFVRILEREYQLPETAGKLWESIYAEHLDELKMRIRRYDPGVIFEFDSLDELRLFDESYISDTRSTILADVARQLGCTEADIVNVVPIKGTTTAAEGFEFRCKTTTYRYRYADASLAAC